MITTNEFKIFADVNSNFYDDAISQIVAGVNAFVEAYCKNKLLSGNVEEFFDDDEVDEDGNLILSNRVNLSGLELFKNTGTEFVPVWTEVATTQYVSYLDEGRLSIDVAGLLFSGRKAWKVTYTAGYKAQSAPADLKMACLKLAGAVYNKRKSEGESSEGLDGATVNFAGSITDEIKSLLAKYKSFAI
jgi:hypothetical protein